MNNNICDTCQHYQTDVCPIYDHDLPFETCPNHWSKRKNKPTVFQQITASEEVLAEKLVYPVSYHWVKYTSTLIPGHKRFDTKEQAIAATVAKLKEVAE